MDSKICLVTGANAGLGKALAAGLAQTGATVVMVCRDRSRGEAAQADIRAQTNNTSIDLMIADLSSQQSIRQLAEKVKSSYSRLDVLINNAAVFKAARTLTDDKLEMMFATNHLAPFLLTTLLLDTLKASPSARVLTVTAPSTVKLDMSDLQGERHFNALSAFGASKMANLLFTFELARQVEGTSVTANAIHPGLVRSGLMNEANPIMRFVIGLISKPPEQAVGSIVRVATSTAFAGQNGQFFLNGKTIRASDYAYDRDVQRQLWGISERLTNTANSTTSTQQQPML